MKEGSYTEFSDAMHGLLSRGRTPSTGTLELTHRCPLNCSHCYNNLPMNDAAARAAEMTTEEIYRLLDELAEANCLWLLLTGGEIFARRDFFEIYEYAKRKAFLITLFTNGILVDERIADRLAAMPPFAIEITIYGATRETYEALTRIPGSYDKCLRGIRLLLERGLPLSLKTVAVSTNKHEIWEMKALAEELGVEFKFDGMINPRIDCSAAPLEVRLTPSELVELDLRDPVRVDEWRRLAKDCAPVFPADAQSTALYGCGGGSNNFAVDPFGNLSICIISQFDKYNVRTGSFEEGWNGPIKDVRARQVTRITKCTRCSLRSMCGMCPANGELENQDAEEPVEFLCETSHLRAEAFGIVVPPHGDCDFCSSRRDYIVEEAAAIHARAKELPAVPSLTSPAASCGGGCSGCSVR